MSQSSCFQNSLKGTDAYRRHVQYINNYVLFYKNNSESSSDKKRKYESDLKALKKHHRFLEEEEEEKEKDKQDDKDNDSWARRVAKRYYDRLYKEYCLADLKFYEQGKIAMRWRTEAEVFKGKGQFICGELGCQQTEELTSWEVNFGYIEEKQKKNALVKLRLCHDCSVKLNYKKKMTKVDEKLNDLFE